MTGSHFRVACVRLVAHVSWAAVVSRSAAHRQCCGAAVD
eukprot:CAMPEP_0203945658 /NCGR_PEP_ID=MMETSP0359-20131031/81131_1 /ASSEMBLY_ACC=CAM_ASM_000338 /TAXON_ID=268821 /ORGANISM="Scrippsiella Hangoei, Strain SHTV-5" /LENGTH=38 /DNA_ID= /DNA_START= /DNA_END= /DNA_ORIENTATION=